MSYIKKVLVPGEVILYKTHLHPILFFPALSGLLVSIMILLLGTLLQIFHLQIEGHMLSNWLALFVLGLSGFLAFNAWIVLKTSEYVLTDRRIIMKSGWIGYTAIDILLMKVESLTINQGVWGRLLGYGTVIICGTGGSKDPFHQVRYPLEFHNRVQTQLEKIKK